MSLSARFSRHLTAVNGLSVCLALSAGALFVAEAVGPLHLLLLLAAAIHQRRRWGAPPAAPESIERRKLIWERAAIGAFVFFIADLFFATRNLIGAALRLLVFLVCAQADTPRTPRGARQTLTLTFIQVVAATASTTEMSFSIWMALYLVAATYTLAALNVSERGLPSGPLSPAAPAPALRPALARLTMAAVPIVIGCGLAVFFVIPHYGTGYFREASRTTLRRSLTGFSDRIELGSIGSIKKSHATVMRVASAGSAPLQLPLRMRGIALDRYDGRTWSVSGSRRRWLQADRAGTYVVDPDVDPRDGRRSPDRLHLSVVLEPLDTHVLFTPPGVVSVSLPRFDGVEMDGAGSLFTAASSSRRFEYAVESLARRGSPGAPPGAAPPERADAYLQLPDLDPRIAAVARDATRRARTPLDKARALEAHLRASYAYSLDVNDATVASPLVHFLIERRPGHCEYFATALAILLRVEGIPSRVVNGFYGGERSELTDQTILRQSDAHSWVEAWIPGEGWMTLDPTPADTAGLPVWDLGGRLKHLFEESEIAWDTWIVGLDLEDQRGILEDVRDRIDLALAAIVVGSRRLAAGMAEGIGLPGAVVSAAFLLAAAAIAALAIAAWAALRAFRGWRRRRAGLADHPATALFRAFEDRCRRAGWTREPSVSPGEFARTAGATEVAVSFEAARYGEPATQPEAIERLRASIRGFRAPAAPPRERPTSRRPG
ncbi:MAG TPA: transglutaminaseTgpA domain-containing protein [Verrucomicrobiae bacterium]|nr:transglutaminaseTgpA domain-containing protein [Verrucomicrobiae bacterium]